MADTFTGDTSEAEYMTGQTNGAMASPPSGRTLDVARAEKIIRAFTKDPSWLADPRTSQAANSVFSAASKVVGMNLQLERLASQAEAAKARNSMEKQVGNSLLKLAESGPDGAKIASKWYGPGDDGKPLYQNPTNWSAILSDYQTVTAPVAREAEIGGTRGWMDPKGNFHADPTALIEARQSATLDAIEARFQNQLALIDPKNEAAVERLRERYRLARELFNEQLPQKTAAAEHLIGVRKAAAIELAGNREQNAEKLAAFKKELGGDKPDRPISVTETDPVTGTKVTRRMTLADAEQLPAVADAATHRLLTKYAEEKAAIEAGDESVGPDWLGLSNRAKTLAELKTRIEQKGINPDTGRKIGAASTPRTNSPAIRYELKDGQLLPAK